MSNRSATSEATAECRGSRKPHGRTPNRIRSPRQRPGVITHMNTDHADAMVDYCVAFSKATGVASASMTNIDRYGFEMSAVTPDGPRPVRLAFPQVVTTPDQARDALVRLLKEARARQS